MILLNNGAIARHSIEPARTLGRHSADLIVSRRHAVRVAACQSQPGSVGDCQQPIVATDANRAAVRPRRRRQPRRQDRGAARADAVRLRLQRRRRGTLAVRAGRRPDRARSGPSWPPAHDIVIVGGFSELRRGRPALQQRDARRSRQASARSTARRTCGTPRPTSSRQATEPPPVVRHELRPDRDDDLLRRGVPRVGQAAGAGGR